MPAVVFCTHAEAVAASAEVPVTSPGRAAVLSGRANQLSIAAQRMSGPEAEVVIDGALDEPVWQRATLLTGFSEFQPADDTTPRPAAPTGVPARASMSTPSCRRPPG